MIQEKPRLGMLLDPHLFSCGQMFVTWFLDSIPVVHISIAILELTKEQVVVLHSELERTLSRPFSTICFSFINASTIVFSWKPRNSYIRLNSFTVFSIICPGLQERYFLVSDIRNRRRWEWLDWFSLRKQSRKTGVMYSTQHLILKDWFLLRDSRQFLHF